MAEMLDAPQKFTLLLLRAYKRIVSPLFLPACRYVPSCSEYAGEAVERYGVLRGSALAAWRLLRCHPFARGGFDPVPLASPDDIRSNRARDNFYEQESAPPTVPVTNH
jgi:putative membrane protein insertion efficiency factor